MMSDLLLAPRYWGWLLDGLEVTLVLSALAAVIAAMLGTLLCMARMSASRQWPRLAGIYVALFRNTPLLVQLLFWYFGVAALLPAAWKLWLNTPHRAHWGTLTMAWPSMELLCAVIGLGLYSAAFVAEELVAGVQLVPRGQWQAGTALGLDRGVLWRRIVLPQAMRNALPPLVGQAMNLVKNSSLTMAIGTAELSYAARQVESQTFMAFQAFAAATLLYLAVTAAVELAGQALQRRVWRVRAIGR